MVEDRNFVNWSERHLQALWFEQKYLSQPMKLSDGRALRVIDPGIWNHRGGPDFLSAHLLVEGEQWRGDIEIHFQEQDWHAHLHGQRGEYQSVVLHVCAYHQQAKHPISIPLLYLKDNLQVDTAQILPLLDLDHYPYKQLAISGRCHKEVFSALSPEQTQQFFATRALRRLEQKYRYFEGWAPEKSLMPLFGMGAVLGYRDNTLPFLRILLEAYGLPEQFSTSNQVFAYMIGRGGFFQEAYQRRWGQQEYYQQLLQLWKAMEDSNLLPHHLSLDRIRPANHPLRRLFFLSQLFHNFSYQKQILQWPTLIYESWIQACNARAKNGTIRVAPLLKEWQGLIPEINDSYWSSHYTFQTDPLKLPIKLMGSDLAYEVIVNLFLPILYTRLLQEHDLKAIDDLIAFYRQLPAKGNSRSNYLSWRFFGSKEETALDQSRILQQGAFQLHGEFCVHFEASCSGCNFPESCSQFFRKKNS
jgi:hypothetical protein